MAESLSAGRKLVCKKWETACFFPLVRKGGIQQENLGRCTIGAVAGSSKSTSSFSEEGSSWVLCAHQAAKIREKKFFFYLFFWADCWRSCELGKEAMHYNPLYFGGQTEQLERKKEKRNWRISF